MQCEYLMNLHNFFEIYEKFKVWRIKATNENRTEPKRSAASSEGNTKTHESYS